MSDVVAKLWGFCHTLRHDGIDYGDYIEQITYLLFLKMADERGLDLPKETDWAYLRRLSGSDLIDGYIEALRLLGKESGILGDIFAGAQNRFTNPVNLKKLIGLIDETEWVALDVDVKAAAFEGLLEKAASEGKKGAGQYFTPRILIETMVRCVKPDPRAVKDFKLGDPACGTGGFLVAAYDWLMDQTGGALDREAAKRVRTNTYYGQELVARPRRLALMNLYLHQVEPRIKLGDSIYESPGPERFDVVLTNPPFGTKGANQAPDRDDFVVSTSNKQLNFLQHVLTTLKVGGRAAVVVPDHVLFADQAGEVFKVLMEDCNLHSVLRCPRGTFTPYSGGTKTNVIFFTKGRPTERVWIFDARANVPQITKKTRPLSPEHFASFEECYGKDPNGLSKRREDDSPEGRWRQFSLDEVQARHYKLDGFKWLKDETSDDLRDLPDAEELITDISEGLRLALDDLGDIQRILEEGTANGSETNDQLPEGWAKATLPQVAKITMGQSPPGSSYNTDERGLPFFQGKAEFGRDHPTVRKWCSEPSRVAQAGDILMSIRAPVGPTNVADRECAIGRGLAAIRPREGVEMKIIRWAIGLQETEIASWGTGTTFTAINKDHLQQIEVPLPPTAEQERIVAAAEPLLTRVDQATERVRHAYSVMLGEPITTAASQTERLKRAILAKAFRGELVPTEAELALREGRSFESADQLIARLNTEAEEVSSARRKRARK